MFSWNECFKSNNSWMPKEVTQMHIFLEWMMIKSNLECPSRIEPLQCCLCFWKLWWMHFEFNLECLVEIGRESWDTNTLLLGLKKNHKLLNAKVKIQHHLPTWRASRCTSFILVDPNSCLLFSLLRNVYSFIDVYSFLLTTRCLFGMNFESLNMCVFKVLA